MLVHVSIGELIDKFTILLIKNSKINDQEKLNKVSIEIDYLKSDVENIKNKYESQIFCTNWFSRFGIISYYFAKRYFYCSINFFNDFERCNCDL